MARSSSRVLTDHDEIRQWAEERSARPASVRRTGQGDIGMIRLEFPDAPNANDSNLEEISWDDFFEKFDESNLALLVQDELAEGGQSNFNKLVSRETAGGKSRGGAARSSGRGPASARASKSAGSSSRKTAAKSSGRASGRSSTKKAAKKSASKKATKKAATKKSSSKKAAARRAGTRGTSGSPAKHGSTTAKRVPSGSHSGAERVMMVTKRTPSTINNRGGGKRTSHRGNR